MDELGQIVSMAQVWSNLYEFGAAKLVDIGPRLVKLGLDLVGLGTTLAEFVTMVLGFRPISVQLGPHLGQSRAKSGERPPNLADFSPN